MASAFLVDQVVLLDLLEDLGENVLGLQCQQVHFLYVVECLGLDVEVLGDVGFVGFGDDAENWGAGEWGDLSRSLFCACEKGEVCVLDGL